MNDETNNFPQSYKKILGATNELVFNQLSDGKIGSLLATLCASKVKGIFLELGTGTGLEIPEFRNSHYHCDYCHGT